MDARRPHRRRHRIAAVGAVAFAVFVSTLFIPSPAGAVDRWTAMSGGGTLSVRSWDGCSLKAAPPKNGRRFVRNFICIFQGKIKPPPAAPAAPAVSWMANGDRLTVYSADGCVVKPAPPASGRKYVRNFTCIGGAPPPPPPPATGQPPTAVTGGATWRGIWADEFSGAAVDTSKWNVANNSNYGSGNHEDQCYRAANTTVAGGTLRLTGRRQTVSDCGTNPAGGTNYYFTSGMVTTRAQGGAMKMKYRHGYAEVRARVPRGNIYWPAFWLVGPSDGSSPGWPAYGEVDVFEIYGSRPDVAESNFHKTGGNIGAGAHNVNSPPSSSLGKNINPPNAFVAGGTQNWHTYGINWTANKLEWFIDGIKVRTYNASVSADFSALGYEHSIILNLAMGGNGPRYPNHGYTGAETSTGYNNGNLVADLPGTMEIDYVRIWQP